MSLLDLVQQQLGAVGGTEQIANQIGADPATTQNAIEAAIPAILGGMAGNARQGGSGAIADALGQSGGGGGISGMLGGLLGGGGAGGMGGMLGGLLGQHQDTVQQGVQQASGLSGGQTAALLSMLAPVVLNALSQHGVGGQQGGGGLANLPAVLEQHAQDAAEASPAGGGLLGRILGSL